MKAKNCLQLKEKEGGVLLARSAITRTLLIGGRTRVGNLNTTPRSLDRGARPSTSESPLGVAEGYTLSPPDEETWASLSLSSTDNSHASMMSYLNFHRSNARLSSVVKCKGASSDEGLMFPSRTSEGCTSILRRCTVSRKEGKEVVLSHEGLLANTGFVGGSTGREAWARWSLQPLSPSHASTGPQSNFCMAHITQSMVSLRERANSAASSITMA
ncbi:hypothetical protein Cgig2_033916 [Carnegiea gigantea]|uniref:Uncharacterized protein n=1 Tax=Carnegiea gigantea TaxID=171969 RepID=A0A9Q1Q6E2_9CARY|nr:hypothetical protein Cgig2_033916 [Carnegiea gigantea]